MSSHLMRRYPKLLPCQLLSAFRALWSKHMSHYSRWHL